MAKDAGRAITFRRSFKAPSLQTERTKNEGPSEKKRAWKENSLKFSKQKVKSSSHRMENKTKEPQDHGAKTEHETCSQEEINWSKFEKAFRKKLFGLCKTRTKKSSPDLFSF